MNVEEIKTAIAGIKNSEELHQIADFTWDVIKDRRRFEKVVGAQEAKGWLKVGAKVKIDTNKITSPKARRLGEGTVVKIKQVNATVDFGESRKFVVPMDCLLPI